MLQHQAENFDTGGEGISFHDVDPTNQGGFFRATAVDIKSASNTGGGYAIGWFNTGEWLNYSVRVSADGNYDFEARVASGQSNVTPAFHVEVDGQSVTGSITVPYTGAWDTTFTTVRKSGIHLTAGAHVLKVVSDQEWFDLNDLKFTTASTASTAIPSGAVIVSAGADIQAAIDAAPSTAIIYLRAGVYYGQRVTPKSGMTLMGELDGNGRPAATLDGQVRNFRPSTESHLRRTSRSAGSLCATITAAMPADAQSKASTRSIGRWTILKPIVTSRVERRWARELFSGTATSTTIPAEEWVATVSGGQLAGLHDWGSTGIYNVGRNIRYDHNVHKTTGAGASPFLWGGVVSANQWKSHQMDLNSNLSP